MPDPIGAGQMVREMMERPRALPASRRGPETEYSGNPSFCLSTRKSHTFFVLRDSCKKAVIDEQ